MNATPALSPRTRRTRASLWQRLVGEHRGRRLLALVAAIAVPAMAAPGEWQGLTAPAAEPAQASEVRTMPFERAGQSFPGSAFYYLESAPRAAAATGEVPRVVFDPTGTGDGAAAELAASRVAGPAAKAFLAAGSGLDKARALQCLTSAVYYEAASESTAGQKAVAQVVLNRVAHPSYPDTVCGVVYQGSERKTGCQFTFTCDGSLNRKPMKAAWDRALAVASEALGGEVYSPVGLATHYHTIWVHPYWAPSLDAIGTIGAHQFYRWKGAAGTPGAFRDAYRGGEPVAAPHPRSADPVPATETDPLALARAYEKTYEDARQKAISDNRAAATRAPAPPPVYAGAVEARGGDALFTGGNLPAAGGVKEEYANSGRWIAQPGQTQ